MWRVRVAARLAFPSTAIAGAMATAHVRPFHGYPDASKEKRLKSSSIAFNKPRGRDLSTDDFEKKVNLVNIDSHGDIFTNASDRVAVVDLMAMEDVDSGIIHHPATIPLFTEQVTTKLPRSAVKNMRRNADTWAAQYAPGTAHIIHLVDPVISHRMFRREEAQVEMITAYRNVLYEFFDLRTSNKAAETVHVLRVPALCLYTADRFQDDLGKLNQQSLIKGFNRCAQYVKDWFILNPSIRVEIYVPGCFLTQFERAFAEDAWPPMLSVADPGRLTLYKGIPPPRTLLDYPGWHGNRPELLAAVETEGRSIEDAQEQDAQLLAKTKENYRIGLAKNPRSLAE